MDTSDLDTACIELLIDDWVEYVQEFIKKEQQEQIAIPITCGCTHIALPLTAIKPYIMEAAFKIAKYLDVKPIVKYTAIQLFDKFIRCRFWEICKIQLTNNISNASFKEAGKIDSQKSILYLMSCFYLACKMDSTSHRLQISTILNILNKIDSNIKYTLDMIRISEIEVFKTIGYKIPFCTPIQCIEILLAATGLKKTSNVFKISIHFLDFAYLKRDTLFWQFYQDYIYPTSSCIESGKTKWKLLKSDILFLSAVIILCTMLFLKISFPIYQRLLEKLAELSQTESLVICQMTRILFFRAK